MREIKISGGHVALVDDEDYALVAAHKWGAVPSWNTYYARRTICRGGRRSIAMHRVILGLTDRNIHVDHIDHNGLNNTRANLRVCSIQQNTANRPKYQTATSKYKGINLNYGKWQARIQINGKRKHLGMFSDEIEAAKAYDAAALKYFGQFASLNFPGWTDEEIWGEKGSGLSANDFRGTQCETEAGGFTANGRTDKSVEYPASEIHTGTTLDALGDSVSRAFQNARPGPLQRIACTEAAKELDERYEREIQISELERNMPGDQE